MGEVTTGRYDNLIRRVGNMVGFGSKMSEIVPSAMPVFPIEGGPHELQILGGKSTWAAGVIFTPTATFAGHVQLRNPTESNILATITEIRIKKANQSDLRVGVNIGQVFLAPVTTGFARRDTRQDILPVCILETVDVTPTTGGEMITTGFEDTILDAGYTLAPNSLIFIEAAAIGRMTVTFSWTERVAESSELNF